MPFIVLIKGNLLTSRWGYCKLTVVISCGVNSLVKLLETLTVNLDTIHFTPPNVVGAICLPHLNQSPRIPSALWF